MVLFFTAVQLKQTWTKFSIFKREFFDYFFKRKLTQNYAAENNLIPENIAKMDRHQLNFFSLHFWKSNFNRYVFLTCVRSPPIYFWATHLMRHKSFCDACQAGTSLILHNYIAVLLKFQFKFNNLRYFLKSNHKRWKLKRLIFAPSAASV